MLYTPRGQHNRNKRTVIFMIEGGIGDHILATPMLRNARLKFPKDEWDIVVLAMFHEAYGDFAKPDSTGDDLIPYNSNIDVLFSTRYQSKFYVEWAKNADIVYRRNVYSLSPHRFGKIHLTEALCELHEVTYDNDTLDLALTDTEERQAKLFYDMSDKPIVVIQPFGGYDPLQHKKITSNKDWDDNNKWYGVIQALVNRGYEVVQLGAIGEYIFPNVTSFVGHASIRESFALIKYCDFFISVDTYAIHVAKAFKKPGIVLWGRTNPYRVGYTDHYNIYKLHSCPEIFCGRPENIFVDSSPNKPYFTPWECPNRKCMKEIGLKDVYKGIDVIQRHNNIDPITYEREKFIQE
jgi:ADP-heptose:LPS heptosyltransferase